MNLYCLNVLDSFLRNRSSSDHEATAMMKAQFMSLWDGLETDYNCQVQFRIFVRFTGLISDSKSKSGSFSIWCVVIVFHKGHNNGSHQSATRSWFCYTPKDAYKIPHQSACKFTDFSSRNVWWFEWNVQFYCWIIKLCCDSYKWSFVICVYLEYKAEERHIETDPGEWKCKFLLIGLLLLLKVANAERTFSHFLKVESAVDFGEIAKKTDGFSGSDLREMCRDAALLCVRDFVHQER